MWACVWQCEGVWHGVLYSCIVWQFSKWATEEVDKSDDYKKWVGQSRPLNVSTHACTLNQPGLTLNPINGFAPYFLRWRTFQTPSMDFYPRETFPQSKMLSHTFKVVFLAGIQVFFLPRWHGDSRNWNSNKIAHARYGMHSETLLYIRCSAARQ